jgi:hypothetical protein
MAVRAGGVACLADMLHVSRRTIERLVKRPPESVPFAQVTLVNQIAKQLGAVSPFEEKKSVTIRAVKKTG